jgi:CTP synthase
MPDDVKKKIAMFCNVKPDCVIENITLPVLYQAPIMLEKSNFSEIVCRELNLKSKPLDLTEWNQMLDRIEKRDKTVSIALVGKYIRLHDAYLSVVESLVHAGYENNSKIDIQWIDSESITKENVDEKLKTCQGILNPGGFGNRGIEGKIIACEYARVNNIPYLGICLGMQIAAIEFARNVLGYKDANSKEFDETSAHLVIDLMPDQLGVQMGGTMRLGAYPCKVKKDTLLMKAYNSDMISERHRHRFEFNNDYREIFEKNGVVLSGISPDNKLVEAIELPSNKFFIGVQFHPEFKSRPNKAHPIFREFIKASLDNKK